MIFLFYKKFQKGKDFFNYNFLILGSLCEEDVFSKSAQNWGSHIFINMYKKRHSFAVFQYFLLIKFKSKFQGGIAM